VETPIINKRLLVIDDEVGLLPALKSILEGSDYEVSTESNPTVALERLSKESFAAVLCDVKMPGMDGLTLLKRAQQYLEQTTFIVMSAVGTTDMVLEAIKLGAYDYISKPFNASEIVLTLKKAEEREKLRRENTQLKEQVSKRYSFGNIVGQSSAMQEIFNTIKKVADYRTTVMLCGESGTGKELIAKAIHFNSNRKGKRFVAINCGAIPENLLESELFGHRKGAFTDATKDKKGLFEEAEGGTMFLDEIGELPLHLQVKLLRVLQEGEIRPVGGSENIPVDVRIVAATLRDLEQDIIDGRFRDDLFYRLDVVSIKIPPLRERKEEIPVLTQHFLEKHRQKLGLNVTSISTAAMQLMIDYHWPGNIRELENSLERAMILCNGREIVPDNLPKTIAKQTSELNTKSPTVIEGGLSIKVHSRNLEVDLIRKALEKTGGNRTHASKLLEISHRTLLYKLKEYGLDSKEDSEAVEE